MAIDEAAWRNHLGPLLDAKQVQELMGVRTRQAVSDLRTRHRILGLTRQDGRVVYPAFQFGPGGRPFAELPEILRILSERSADLWTVASWVRDAASPSRGPDACRVAPAGERAGATPPGRR